MEIDFVCDDCRVPLTSDSTGFELVETNMWPFALTLV